ncbi:MAG: DUF2288 family protein [Myxococcales bacterium]|nr:DUF2288 family protein [Myxococcales bacterium]
MSGDKLREKIQSEIQATSAAELLPHLRRDALFIVRETVDMLDAAVAIAGDESRVVAALIEGGNLYKPSLAQLSDWCVDLELRFQFVILQPYVLAQPIVEDRPAPEKTQN